MIGTLSSTLTTGDTPLAAALARVGDRWKLLVVDALLEGPRRFSDLEAAVAGISTNVLSDRLRSLEQDGLVITEAYSERPTRYEYTLTATGRELAGALHLLAEWGRRFGDDGTDLRHELCGTQLEVGWYCPTCGVRADREDGAAWRL